MSDFRNRNESTGTFDRPPGKALGGRFAHAVLFVSIALLAGCGDEPTKTANLPSIRMNPGSGDLRLATFEVTGLPAETLDYLSKARELDSPNRSRFIVRVSDGDDLLATGGDTPPMAGSWSVEGSVLRFRPSLPLQFGQRYLAVFDPKNLPGLPGDTGLISAIFMLPKPKAPPLPPVPKAEPTSGNVPETMLPMVENSVRKSPENLDGMRSKCLEYWRISRATKSAVASRATCRSRSPRLNST